MANLHAVHDVGNSLITFLRNTYPESLRDEHSCTFSLMSSSEMVDLSNAGTTLSLYLYRVTINEFMRNSRQQNGIIIPLSLDLHYLLTIWADSALVEHTILTWAMNQIYLNPILNVSILQPDAGWQQNDVVQVIPEEISNEDVMRIWDTLEPAYRLSFPYVARTVRIEPDEIPDSRAVVATRFDYQDFDGPRQGWSNGNG